MTHINVVTMKVTTPVYTMFIVLSFVVCPSDCGVSEKRHWWPLKPSIHPYVQFPSNRSHKVLLHDLQ